MAFIDRLKDAYKTANDEVRRLRSVWEDCNEKEYFDAWKSMEDEKEFIKKQLKANGFDLDIEAERIAVLINAYKCKECGMVFEISQDCTKHIIERHVLALVSAPNPTPH